MEKLPCARQIHANQPTKYRQSIGISFPLLFNALKSKSNTTKQKPFAEDRCFLVSSSLVSYPFITFTLKLKPQDTFDPSLPFSPSPAYPLLPIMYIHDLKSWSNDVKSTCICFRRKRSKNLLQEIELYRTKREMSGQRAHDQAAAGRLLRWRPPSTQRCHLPLPEFPLFTLPLLALSSSRLSSSLLLIDIYIHILLLLYRSFFLCPSSFLPSPKDTHTGSERT